MQGLKQIFRGIFASQACSKKKIQQDKVGKYFEVLKSTFFSKKIPSLSPREVDPRQVGRNRQGVNFAGGGVKLARTKGGNPQTGGGEDEVPPKGGA